MENQAMMIERSMRSVFVGNIPFDMTEEKLRDIFSEVGPVLSFKLVYDRENGKPKGYGFCEYKDVETANSAMRNLNGYEIGGRVLKVDNAANEKNRIELQMASGEGADTMMEPMQESMFDHLEPDKVPEAISKAVASLPPEQMFELMKQMKQCITNNPHEARNMLLQNPQLAYGLLQSLVVMRIVDPEIALTMLSKRNNVPDLMNPTPVQPLPIRPEFTGQPMNQMNHNIPPMINSMNTGMQPMNPNAPNSMQSMPMMPMSMNAVPQMNNIPTQQMPPISNNDMDRSIDPRSRMMAGPPSTGMSMGSGDVDLRTQVPMPVPAPGNQQHSNSDSGMRDPRQPPLPVAPPRDPRSTDPRAGASTQPPLSRQQPLAKPKPVAASSQSMPNMAGMIGDGVSDQEKAALIMQVLQLTNEQIAMLPPEQRQSILLLKEQIAKSSQR